MDRRTVLAGIGSTGIAAVAGCTGFLGDGGGPCSTPDSDDSSALMPEEGDGFTLDKEFDSEVDDPDIEDATLARYSDDEGRGMYIASVVIFASEEAAEGDEDEDSEGTVIGKTAFVQTGRYLFNVAAPSSNADEDRMRALLKRSALSEECVDAEAEIVEA